MTGVQTCALPIYIKGMLTHQNTILYFPQNFRYWTRLLKISGSLCARSILNKTPIVGTMVNDTYKAILDINDLKEKYKNNNNKDEYNAEILDIMLKYEVVTPEVTDKLIKNKKIEFKGANTVLNKYKESAK